MKEMVPAGRAGREPDATNIIYEAYVDVIPGQASRTHRDHLDRKAA